MSKTLMFQFTRTLALAALLALACVESVHATVYTWIQNSTGPQTWNWGTPGGTGNSYWSSGNVFADGTGNTLTFFADTTTALASGVNNITGSLPSASTMNVLTLNGNANATATTINIGSSSSTWALDGTSPTVNLNGTVTSGSGTKDLLYNIAANLTLNQATTTFAGTGGAGGQFSGRPGFTFSGNIGGISGAAISKTGATSILTLSGNNTFSGGITVGGDKNSAVVFGNNNAAGSGTITLNIGQIATTSSSVTVTNAISVLGTANTSIGNSSFGWGGQFSGPINVGTSSDGNAVTLSLNQNNNNSGGTVILTGDISKTTGGSGTATISPAGNNSAVIKIQSNVNGSSVGLTVGKDQTVSTEIGNASGGKTQNWGAIDLSPADAGTLRLKGNVSCTSLAGAASPKGGVIVGGDSTVYTLTDSQTTTTTFNGMIGGPLANQTNVALNLSSSGTLTLAGANYFTGGLTVGGGNGTVKVTGGATITTSGTLTAASGTKLTLSSTSGLIVGQTVAAGTYGGITIPANAVIQDVSSSTIIYLNQSVSGTISGNPTINFGSSYTSIGGTANPVTVNTSGTLDIQNTTQTIGSLTGSGGTVSLGSGSLTVGADNTSPAAFQGVISGTGSLTKTGTGTLTLSGPNTYNGGTTNNGGILNAGIAQNGTTSGPLGASGNIVFGGGTLQFSSASASWDPSSRIAAGTSTAAVTIDTAGQSITFGTALTSSQSGGLIKMGTGTLTLSQTEAYTGATIVSNGTLNVTGSLASGSAVTVDGVTSGTLGGSGTINGTVTLRNGGIIQPSSSGSVNTLTFANSTAPTYNTGSKLTLRVNGTSLDRISFSAAAAHSLANLDLHLDLSSISGPVTGTTIYSVASGSMTSAAFHTVTLDNNPGGAYSATVHYNATTITVDLYTSAASASHSTISPATATKAADGVSTQTITVQARDSSNNNLTSGGESVLFTATAGSMSATTDNGNGTYTATWTAPSSIGTGSATVTATLGGNSVGTAVSASSCVITLTTGPANAAHSTISPATATKLADGVATQAITVQARDSLNNNRTSGGDTVVFSATAGTMSGTTDNANGTYTATWTAPTSVGSGTATVSATLGGTTVGTAVSASSCVITLNTATLAWSVGNGDWDINTTANWAEGGVTGYKYQDAENVILDDTASGTSPIAINVAQTVTPASVTANLTNKIYTLSGNAIAGSGSLTKNGSGTLVLSNANTFSGGVSINGGTVQFLVSGALGTGSATLTTGTTLDFNGTNASVQTVTNLVRLTGGSQTLRLDTTAPQNVRVVFTGDITNADSGTGTLTIAEQSGSGNGTTGGIAFVGNKVSLGAENLNLVGWNVSGYLPISNAVVTLTTGNLTGVQLGNNFGNPALPGGIVLQGNTTVTLSSGYVGGSGVNFGLAIQDQAHLTAPVIGGPGKGMSFNLNGGTMTVGTIALTNASSTMNFNGGVLQSSAASADFIQGTNVTLTVQDGGAVLDTQTYPVTINLPFTGTGTNGLVKLGASTLTLTATNTYTGPTTISAGTLALSGGGSIASTNLTVATNATFDVSAISGSSYTLPTSGGLMNYINKTGATLTQGQIKLDAKSLAYGGSLTVVSNANSAAFAAGDSFTLVSKTSGTLSGWFGGVTLPALNSGLAWDTNNLATSGALDVYNFTTTALEVSTPENSNAVVSASKLANHASSSKGTAVAVSASTPGHGSASITGGSLTYSPESGYVGPDSFTVTFSDGHGIQTMAVSVTVGSGTGTSPNLLGQMVDGSNFVLKFAGYPGQSYTVETNPVVGPGWVKLGNYTAPTDGIILVTNTMGTNSLFFRTVWPAY